MRCIVMKLEKETEDKYLIVKMIRRAQEAVFLPGMDFSFSAVGFDKACDTALVAIRSDKCLDSGDMELFANTLELATGGYANAIRPVTVEDACEARAYTGTVAPPDERILVPNIPESDPRFAMIPLDPAIESFERNIVKDDFMEVSRLPMASEKEFADFFGYDANGDLRSEGERWGYRVLRWLDYMRKVRIEEDYVSKREEPLFRNLFEGKEIDKEERAAIDARLLETFRTRYLSMLNICDCPCWSEEQCRKQEERGEEVWRVAREIFWNGVDNGIDLVRRKENG